MSIPEATTARTFKSSATHFVSVWNLAILLVLLILVFSFLKGDTFLTAFTFQSMMNSRSINAMVALAVMIPLASNNFDLSVASILGVSQVLANGLQTQQGLPWEVAALACIALGAFVGLVNGLLVARAKINSFIATLGTGTLLLGLNQWYTGGRQVVGLLPADFVALSGKIPHTGVPAAVVYVLIIAIVLWVVFDYLPLGRYLYVIGDSPRAAELTGINATTYVTLAFVASGTLAAFAGVMLAGAASGRPEHGRPGADAAGLHRRAARRDRHSPRPSECLGHGARGRRSRGRGRRPDAAWRAVLRGEPLQRRDARARRRACRLHAAPARTTPGRGQCRAETMSSGFDLAGQTILVTGAARGIGAATARDLRLARRERHSPRP